MGKKRIYGQFASGKLDNVKHSLGAASSMTYHIVDDGTDTSSNTYFNFDRQAIKVTVRATVVCSVTEWNDKVLKSPLTINPGVNVIEVGCYKFKLVTTASSVVEVTLK